MTDHAHGAGKALHLLDRMEMEYLFNKYPLTLKEDETQSEMTTEIVLTSLFPVLHSISLNLTNTSEMLSYTLCQLLGLYIWYRFAYKRPI